MPIGQFRIVQQQKNRAEVICIFLCFEQYKMLITPLNLDSVLLSLHNSKLAYSCTCFYPRPSFPPTRSKMAEQTVTDDCHFSLCLCNDVPIEFTRCERLYCLLWRTSARHKDFIHQICKIILAFYEECSCSPDREVYLT